MSRPKKTKINLNKDSLTEFMQEIYNDSSNLMNSARKELNERKSRAEVEDIGDEYQIGKVNNETLKLIDSAIDKKLSLAKLQSQIVSSNKELTYFKSSLSEKTKGTSAALVSE